MKRIPPSGSTRRGARKLARPARRRANPVPASDVGKLSDLYLRFSGHKLEPLAEVRAPTIPRVAAVIGFLDGVDYTTVRDGKTEKYRHTFKAKARPVLCTDAKGQIFIVAGRYRFTELGIVDQV
jgi:hypothetical protein